MAPAITPELLGGNLIATKYAYVASTTILFWDMGLTMNQEITRVWKARKTFGTYLFFCNRYLPPAIFFLDLVAQFRWDPTIQFCKNYEYASTLLDFVSIAIVECVLVLRTHALYQNRTLFFVLAFLGFIAILNMLICFLIIIKLETFVPASTLGLVGCLSGCTNPSCKSLLIAFWVPFLTFETTIFLLTAWKSYKTYRLLRRGGDRSIKLIEILFRDGLIYYLVIMATSLMNFFIWIFDPFASYLAVGLLKCLQATICSRLLLNIRGMLEPELARSIFTGTQQHTLGISTKLTIENIGLSDISNSVAKSDCQGWLSSDRSTAAPDRSHSAPSLTVKHEEFLLSETSSLSTGKGYKTLPIREE